MKVVLKNIFVNFCRLSIKSNTFFKSLRNTGKGIGRIVFVPRRESVRHPVGGEGKLGCFKLGLLLKLGFSLNPELKKNSVFH